MERDDSRILLIESGMGETVSLGGLEAIIKLTSGETTGAYAIVEHVLQPGMLGSPPHSHTHEDEVSVVLEGVIGVQIGEEVFEASAGSYIVKPRGIPHAFWNSSAHRARFVEIISPPEFEQYFIEAADLLSKDGPPDLEGLAQLAGRYGLTMHMERIPDLMQRFGVSLGP